ncbi:hypothetical protein [Amycolatopsis mediterranei]|uniref:hypothetical protein n=1 Tax=Amycolatopsis mediterranei TaxID=33910 RepID=UPI000B051B32|nr:hypothetical protein [Amycolatopsis mediterranei]UZF74062.1 hypothetical protein ISP_007545 [Amycolatopsis mediterranei]
MEVRQNGSVSPETLAGLKKVFDGMEFLHQSAQKPWPAPSGGSSLFRDNQETDPYQIGHAVTNSLVGAIDHIQTLSALVGRAGVIPARATFTILRGALENASTAAWLLQPASRDERILRRLRWEWTNMTYRAKAMKLADPGFSLEPDRKQTLLDIGSKRGFSGQKQAQILQRTTFSEIVRAAASAIDEVPEDVAEIIWNECSGVAHGQTWAVLAMADHEQLRESAEGILDLRLTAPDSDLLTTTLLVGIAIITAWNLRAERGNLVR